MQTHWSYRARIKGTLKGKRKETFSVPRLFISPYMGNPSPADAERATKEAAALAIGYRSDRPLSIAWQVTELEQRQEEGYIAETEALYPVHVQIIPFIAV